MLTIDVHGTPAQQGSKKGFYNARTQRVQVVDDNKAPLKSWRAEVTNAAITAHAGRPPILGPVEVTVVFYLRRPLAHYGTGRNAQLLKPGAPAMSDKKPDLDKLARAILDSLTSAAVYRDDAQVSVLQVSKEYADGPTGARITVAPLTAVARPVVEAGDGTEQEALIP